VRRRRLVLLLALSLAASTRAAAQSLELKPQQGKGTIGDRMVFDVTVRLLPGMELIDAVPHTLVPPPRGILLLAADTLRPDGAGRYRGTATFGFYRVGPQPVPTLALLYRAAAGASPDTLLHLPISIDIVPILEPGNPSLRDIKPLQPLGGPVWGQLAGLLAAIAAAGWWLYRRKGTAPATVPAPATVAVGPFDAALARLADLERAARQSGNGVVPLYSAIADLVRDCLLQVGAVPHRGLTTEELGRTLPATLSAGDLQARCGLVLGDADLVKFALVRPDRAAAGDQVARTRTLLEAWRAAAGATDAIR
jgi:hypothetical protein